MSRIYISADLEGVLGVVSPLQCASQPDRPAYDAAVARMAREVSLVAEAALAAGATDVLVNDAHCSMTNLAVGALPPRVRLLSGKPKVCAMAAGLDKTFDAMILLGYHARAGTPQAVLCHTFHHKVFDVTVNGESYGEGGINALYASLEYGVPVIFASGDDAFCREIRSLIPGVDTLATKRALGYAAADNRPVAEVDAAYSEQVTRLMAAPAAWKNNLLTLAAPYALQVTFTDTLCADTAMMMPGWQRLDGCRVGMTAPDFRTAYQALQSAYAITAYATALYP